MASNYVDPAQTEGFDYQAGSDIFGADGQRIGSLSEKGVQNGYLVVHHGALMGKDAYVPLSSVTDTRQDGIYLDIGKDQLGDYDGHGAPTRAPENIGGAAGGDTWTYEGQGGPAASGQPINQPAPLRMRAPQQTGAANTQFARDRENLAASDVNMGKRDTSYADQADMGATTGRQDAQEVRVPLAEEELIAGKRQKEAGSVGLHKDVVEEEKSVNVPLTHEEVHVEHRPIAGGAVPADQVGGDVFQEKHIDVPVRSEEVVTGKRAQATDEVVINKTPVTEDQQVTDTVRRERLHVDGEDVDVGGANPHLANTLDEDQRATDTQP